MPTSRYRFRIGDLFPADNALARWMVILSAGLNDVVLVNGWLLDGLESDAPSRENLYRVRLSSTRCFQAPTVRHLARNFWPGISTPRWHPCSRTNSKARRTSSSPSKTMADMLGARRTSVTRVLKTCNVKASSPWATGASPFSTGKASPPWPRRAWVGSTGPRR